MEVKHCFWLLKMLACLFQVALLPDNCTVCMSLSVAEPTTLAKKSLQPGYSWGWSTVRSCDIAQYRLRLDIDATCGICALRACVADRSQCRILSHDRTVDQAHGNLGCNDFFWPGVVLVWSIQCVMVSFYRVENFLWILMPNCFLLLFFFLYWSLSTCFLPLSFFFPQDQSRHVFAFHGDLHGCHDASCVETRPARVHLHHGLRPSSSWGFIHSGNHSQPVRGGRRNDQVGNSANTCHVIVTIARTNQKPRFDWHVPVCVEPAGEPNALLS